MISSRFYCGLHAWQNDQAPCPICTQPKTGYGITHPFDTHKSPPEQTPKGWQCPICTAVMLPSTSQCVNCKGKQ